MIRKEEKDRAMVTDEDLINLICIVVGAYTYTFLQVRDMHAILLLATEAIYCALN